LTKKINFSLIVAIFSIALSACVTQEFEHDETPVVKNQANNDEMAATRVSLGLGYLRMGNMAQAKQNLEKAKKFSPEMVQVYTAFAHYYETVGENKLAIASFEEALSIQSDDADTLNNYGVYLCRQDQTEAAEKQFLKAIAVPSYVLVAKSYENLSSCFLQKDDFVKAEMYLHKAIMHSPGNSSTLFQMVRLQYAMGEFNQAKIYEQRFEKVTRRFTPESLALAYKVYLKLGQRSTAKNYGSMIVKMYPQSWEAQQYLLNKLELIEADNLATRYKLIQLSLNGSTAKSKKRVVKLSPKKTLPSDIEINNKKTINLKNDSGLTSVEIPTKKVPVVSSSNEESTKKIPDVAASNKSSEIHVVHKGDTLYSISMKYNIKIKALRHWNNLYGERKIHINDKIYLIDPKSVNK
jgi:type IV pilus assembly protein PilF